MRHIYRFFEELFKSFEEPEMMPWRTMFTVLWDTFIGSLRNSLRKWFFTESWFKRFFEEPDLVLLWHHSEEPFPVPDVVFIVLCVVKWIWSPPSYYTTSQPLHETAKESGSLICFVPEQHTTTTTHNTQQQARAKSWLPLEYVRQDAWRHCCCLHQMLRCKLRADASPWSDITWCNAAKRAQNEPSRWREVCKSLLETRCRLIPHMIGHAVCARGRAETWIINEDVNIHPVVEYYMSTRNKTVSQVQEDIAHACAGCRESEPCVLLGMNK